MLLEDGSIRTVSRATPISKGGSMGWTDVWLASAGSPRHQSLTGPQRAQPSRLHPFQWPKSLWQSSHSLDRQCPLLPLYAQMHRLWAWRSLSRAQLGKEHCREKTLFIITVNKYINFCISKPFVLDNHRNAQAQKAWTEWLFLACWTARPNGPTTDDPESQDEWQWGLQIPGSPDQRSYPSCYLKNYLPPRSH